MINNNKPLDKHGVVLFYALWGERINAGGRRVRRVIAAQGLTVLGLCTLVLGCGSALANEKCLCSVSGSRIVVERAQAPKLDAATLVYGRPTQCRMTRSNDPEYGFSIGLKSTIAIRVRASSKDVPEPGRIMINGTPGRPDFELSGDYVGVKQGTGSLQVNNSTDSSGHRLSMRVTHDVVHPSNGMTTAYTLKSGSYIDVKYACGK